MSPHEIPSVTVLGIDGSTDWTGVAIVRRDSRGNLTYIAGAAFDASSLVRASGMGAIPHGDSETAKFARIRETSAAMAKWFGALPIAVDVVAYEKPPIKALGTDRGQALCEAVGAYLTLSHFAPMQKMDIALSSARAVWGGNQLASGKNADSAAKDAKRKMLKAACIAWMRQRLGLALPVTTNNQREESEAIADALAVAIAAGKKWFEDEEALLAKKAQPSLPGTSGTTRKAKAPAQKATVAA